MTEVTLQHRGKQFGATYRVSDGMLHLKTHTETRSMQLAGQEPEALARQLLTEIVSAQAGSNS